jgi:fructosamine-3-kinase
MMRLFGGFETRTFEADSSAFPLGPGWAEHVALGHVDPLLVHVCLFAGNDVG